MRKRNYRRRKFKASSTRRLSSSDLSVLDFLWTWKVASLPMLREVAYRNKSYWWVYKALRQLRVEKYIELLPRGKNLDIEVFTLTEHGFEVVLMDRDDIKEYRYRVHAPAHDYLGTCLQLGDLWQSKTGHSFLTEQMLASLAPSNFPSGYKKAEGHVPDGLTILENGLKEVVIGYEVDLNLKQAERYQETQRYYLCDCKADIIIWLVRNKWIATRIFKELSSAGFGGRADELGRRFLFVEVNDFKANVWEAKIMMGPLSGTTLRKIHANALQTLGKLPANFGQKPMRDIFFPKFRSPQKLTTYKKGVDPKTD